jgi:hypothetical protein
MNSTKSKPAARARELSVCAAAGCTKVIFPGQPITRRPEGGWRHVDCANPGRRPQIKDDAR